MQVKIDQVSDVKVGQYGPSSKIKCGNEFYFVNEDATPLVGKVAEITVETKTSAKGNQYKIAKIVKVLEGAAAASSNGHGSGRVKWDDYKEIAKAAHALALELEPDFKEPDLPMIDRSPARVAFVQTVLVALRDGKIALPEGDDDQIPF